MTMNAFHTPYRYDYEVSGYSGRIYNYLRGRCDYSGRVLRAVKYDGKVLLNGEPTFYSRQCGEGDRITVILPEERPDDTAGAIPLNLIYEDSDILIADKPPYMLVHPSGERRENTLVNSIYLHWRDIGYTGKVHFVSRLDMNTSGLITIGRNRYVHGALQAMAHKGLIRKRYTAICEGVPEKEEGTIDAPIERVEGSILRQPGEDGKDSVTQYRVLAENGRYSLVELTILTGRTHQIRVHMKSIGCPVLGDDLYGSPSGMIGRQALHASFISLIQPYTRQELEFSSPFPEDMRLALEAIGIDSRN